MIIDFHTHIFPDKIAERAVSALKASSGYGNFSDGTANGLIASMDAAGVDVSVNMPILSKPESFEKTLAHLKENAHPSGRILSFAPVHPLCTALEEKLRYIRSEGFVGVKLHPYFQNEPLDSAATIEAVRLATDLGLYVMIHPGADASFPDSTLAEPDRIVRLLDAIDSDRIILAHMGAMDRWKQAFEVIAGRNVYLDTSFSMDVMGRTAFLRAVKKHGADRILFGTDSPWRSQAEYVRLLKEEDGLTEEEKDLIFYGNAAKILGIQV